MLFLTPLRKTNNTSIFCTEPTLSLLVIIGPYFQGRISVNSKLIIKFFNFETEKKINREPLPPGHDSNNQKQNKLHYNLSYAVAMGNEEGGFVLAQDRKYIVVAHLER